MPDLLGNNARYVLDSFHSKGVKLSINGSGVVTHQKPAPGSVFQKGDKISIMLRPASAL